LCMLAYYVQWHMVKSLRTLKEQDAETYGSFRLVMERCQGRSFFDPFGRS
jgi:hypothetical protein